VVGAVGRQSHPAIDLEALVRRFGVLGWLFLLVSIGGLFLRYERLQDERSRHHEGYHQR
jgi:hypothetical protein